MSAILEDFIIGFGFGQISMFVWGLWSLAIGLLSGILWVGGGHGWYGTKAWRRIGCPIFICIPFFLQGHVIGAGISFILQILWQTVGYGIPSVNPTDAGSQLGRIFGKWTKIVWLIILSVTMIPLFL